MPVACRWTLCAVALLLLGPATVSAQDPLRVHIAAEEPLRARIGNQLSDLTLDVLPGPEGADLVITATPAPTALALDMRDHRWPPAVHEEVDVVPAREDMDESALYETVALRVRAFVRTALRRAPPRAPQRAPREPAPEPTRDPLQITAGLGVRAALDGSDVPAVGPTGRFGLRSGMWSGGLRVGVSVPQTWSITGAEIQRQRFEAVLEGGLDARFEELRLGGRVWAGAVFELRQTLSGPNPTPSAVHPLLVLGAAPRIGVRWGPVELAALVGVDVWPALPRYRVAGEQASEPWPVQPHAELTITLLAESP